MMVGELRDILKDLPDDMDVILPVVDVDDVNKIIAFRHVRTAGILTAVTEKEPALCLNGAADDYSIAEQLGAVSWGERGVLCKKVLF